MGEYDHQYYFVRKTREDKSIPFLRADDDTSMLDYSFVALPIGKPLVFHNAWKERSLRQRIKEKLSDVLFEGSNMIVIGNIREKLLEYDIPNLHIHPSIYIDDSDKRHEDYWYLTFTKRFDCWDKKLSRYNRGSAEIDGSTIHAVSSYVLSDAILDKTPLNNRLLFKMGGNTDAFITAHESIVNIFNKDGVEIQKVSDYGTT